MGMRPKFFFTGVVLLCALPLAAQQSDRSAQSSTDNAALLQRMKEMEDRIIMLEGKVRMLQAAQPSSPAAPAAGEAQTPLPASSVKQMNEPAMSKPHT